MKAHGDAFSYRFFCLVSRGESRTNESPALPPPFPGSPPPLLPALKKCQFADHVIFFLSSLFPFHFTPTRCNRFLEEEEFQAASEIRPSLLLSGGDAMNGGTGLYEESNTSRTSGETANNNNGSAALQPLHIPAKRLTPNNNLVVTYATTDCNGGDVNAASGVIRHGGQPGWNAAYSPETHSAFVDAHHVPQYNHQPLCNVRESVGYFYNTTIERKPPPTSSIKFWPNSYDAGPSTVTPVPADTCQSFAPQTWCNYSPYSGTRVHSGHMEPHTPQPVSYFPGAEDRPRVPGAMDSYPQTDAYGLRSFPTDGHCPTTFVQSGSAKNVSHNHLKIQLKSHNDSSFMLLVIEMSNCFSYSMTNNRKSSVING
ncbi:UNVERIFIED_CONTAM: hypothetical protein NCL1_18166 [Trichonephila clavipes]